MTPAHGLPAGQASRARANEERLDALGRMASAAAHDLNNLLTPVMGYAELLQMCAEDTAKARTYIDEIVAAGARTGEFARRLALFGRRQLTGARDVDLNDLVRRHAGELQRTLPHGLTLEESLEPGRVDVHADPQQLLELLRCLTENAIAAMPEGGTLTLSTSRLLPRDGEREGTVALSVRDTGCGIPAADLPQVFDPFFKAKGSRGGRGLGLAVAYGVVRRHRGSLEVESAPGEGATFTARMPATVGATIGARATERVEAPAAEATVLVVEDDDGVRSATAESLRRLGYKTVEAARREEALLKAQDAPIDLVLSDIVMPGMEPEAFTEEMGRLQSRAAWLYMTGKGVDRPPGPDGQLPGLLRKPFTQRALARSIAVALRRGAPTSDDA